MATKVQVCQRTPPAKMVALVSKPASVAPSLSFTASLGGWVSDLLGSLNF